MIINQFTVNKKASTGAKFNIFKKKNYAVSTGGNCIFF